MVLTMPYPHGKPEPAKPWNNKDHGAVFLSLLVSSIQRTAKTKATIAVATRVAVETVVAIARQTGTSVLYGNLRVRSIFVRREATPVDYMGMESFWHF